MHFNERVVIRAEFLAALAPWPLPSSLRVFENRSELTRQSHLAVSLPRARHTSPSPIPCWESSRSNSPNNCIYTKRKLGRMPKIASDHYVACHVIAAVHTLPLLRVRRDPRGTVIETMQNWQKRWHNGGGTMDEFRIRGRRNLLLTRRRETQSDETTWREQQRLAFGPVEK